MRLVIQRVKQASVEVNGAIVGSITTGLLVFVGLGQADTEKTLELAARKLSELRIFPDDRDRFQFSVLDASAEILLVPQFTLYADTSKGRRPEFFSAMAPTEARLMFTQFVEIVGAIINAKVATGEFGAKMLVTSVNDGPVTICLNEADLT